MQASNPPLHQSHFSNISLQSILCGHFVNEEKCLVHINIFMEVHGNNVNMAFKSFRSLKFRKKLSWNAM